MISDISNKSNNFWLPLTFLAVLLLGIIIGIKLEKDGGIKEQTANHQKYPQKINQLFRFLDAKYIQETNQSALIQQTIDHLKMADLDTHYIPSKRLRRINEQVEIKPYSQ